MSVAQIFNWVVLSFNKARIWELACWLCAFLDRVLQVWLNELECTVSRSIDRFLTKLTEGVTYGRPASYMFTKHFIKFLN